MVGLNSSKKENLKDEIIRDLRRSLESDLTYESGKILGSMCTQPAPFALQIFFETISKNLGDPALFPGSASLEKQAVSILGSLVRLENPGGKFVSGGSEGNIMALWAARNLSGRRNGNIVCPNTVHTSIRKAADLLNLELKETPVDDNWRAIPDLIEDAIDSKTTAVVGVVGSTMVGSIDPIFQLGEICGDTWLHVDAAFGGLVLPFLQHLGYKFETWDFRVQGVKSMTIDPHKMGLVPIPSGGILFRSKSLEESICFSLPYLSESSRNQTTLTGSRLAAPAIAFVGLFRLLEMDGYAKILDECMTNTRRIAEEMKKRKFNLCAPIVMPICSFDFPKEYNIQKVIEKMRKKGWGLAITSNRKIRFVLMPHILVKHVEQFIEDLDQSLDFS